MAIAKAHQLRARMMVNAANQRARTAVALAKMNQKRYVPNSLPGKNMMWRPRRQSEPQVSFLVFLYGKLSI